MKQDRTIIFPIKLLRKRATDDERKAALKGKRGAEASKINMKYKSAIYTDIYKKLIDDYEDSCHQ